VTSAVSLVEFYSQMAEIMGKCKTVWFFGFWFFFSEGKINTFMIQFKLFSMLYI